MTSARAGRQGVTVHVVSDLAELQGHGAAWDLLALQSHERSPMLSHAWVSTHLETRVPAGTTWRCFLAYHGSELVGVLPLLSEPKPLGSHLRTPSDSQTTVGHPLLARDFAREALGDLLSAVADVWPRHLWLRFRAVREASPLLSPLVHPARVRVTVPWMSRGSLVRTSGSFEEFEATLSSNFRRNLRKANNRAQRERRVVAEFIGGADAGDPQLLRQFLSLEGSGWKGDQGTAIAANLGLVSFYELLTSRLADRGWLQWQRLTFDGALVAAHLAVQFGRALVLPKIAYDEHQARLGPGSMLLRETLSRAFADDAVDEVNCLTDMPWHRNWAMPQETYSDLLITPRRPLPILASLRHSPTLRTTARRAAGKVPGLLPILRHADGGTSAREPA